MDLQLILISPDPALGKLAAQAAEDLPVRITTASTTAQAETWLSAGSERRPPILLVDLDSGESLHVRQWVRQKAPSARVFFMVPAADLASNGSGTAFDHGVCESGERIARPREVRDLTCLLARLLGETAFLDDTAGPVGLEDLVGRSIGFRAAVERALTAVSGDGPVLLTGEAGSGKGFFARAIHEESGRDAGCFVRIDCRTIDGPVLESLWSSPAAPVPHPGIRLLLESAEGGTLYLEDISTLDRPLQAGLARWLDAQRLAEVQRGSRETSPAALAGKRCTRPRSGIRLIAGTSYDLSLASRTGAFDRDLYKRLSETEIKVPALRERPSDILLLTDQFLSRLGRPGVPIPRLTGDAKEKLLSHSWPGNVRELIGVVQVALRKSGGAAALDLVHLAHAMPGRQIPAGTVEAAPSAGSHAAYQGESRVDSGVAPEAGAPACIRYCDGQVQIELPDDGVSFDELEKAILVTALTRARGNVVRAARLLRLGRGSLRYRLEKHAIMQPRRRRVSRRGVQPDGKAGPAEKLSRAS